MKKEWSVLAAVGLTSVLNYLFGIVMGWLLTPTEYGRLGVAQSLLLLLALVVGAGFAWTVAQGLAANSERAAQARLFKTAVLGNALFGAALVAGVWLAYALNLLPLEDTYRALMILIGISTLAQAARSVFNGALRGLLRFGALAVNLVGEVAIKFGVGLGLVALGWGAVGAMIGFAVGTGAALAHSIYALRDVRFWSERGGWFERKVYGATAPLFVGVLGPAVLMNLDLLGLKIFAPAGLGDEWAGLYQAAAMLARAPVFVASALMLVQFSQIAGAAPRARAYLYARQALRLALVFLAPLGIGLAVAPEAALAVVFGGRYAASASALAVAGLGGTALTLAAVLIGVLQALGQPKVPAWVVGASALIQLGALYAWVPEWGAVGAAVSLLLASACALGALLFEFGRSAPGFTRSLGSVRGWNWAARYLIALAVWLAPLRVFASAERGLALVMFIASGTLFLIAVTGLGLMKKEEQDECVAGFSGHPVVER